jgi:hypothetical protein
MPHAGGLRALASGTGQVHPLPDRQPLREQGGVKMNERQKAKTGWFEVWREQRRARRHQALEREYLEHDRACADGTSDSYQHTAPAAAWFGSFGDGGGGGDCGGG